MDPTIEEFCRAKELQLGPMRRMQRYFATVIQAQLDEREQLLIEVEALRREVEDLKAPKKRQAVTV